MKIRAFFVLVFLTFNGIFLVSQDTGIARDFSLSRDNFHIDYIQGELWASAQAMLPSIQLRSNQIEHDAKDSRLTETNFSDLRVRDIFQARQWAKDLSRRNAQDLLQKRLRMLPLDSSESLHSFLLQYPMAQIDFMQWSGIYRMRNQIIHQDRVITTLSKNFFNRSGNSQRNLHQPYADGSGNRFIHSITDLYLKYKAPVTRPTPHFGENKKSTVFTSLIIDLRQFDVDLVLFPRILDESGFILYDVSLIERDFLTKSSIVEYRTSLREAKKSLRAGDNPYYLLPIAVTGEQYRSDPVLLRKHTRRLLANPASIRYLREARVIFIISDTAKKETKNELKQNSKKGRS